MLKVHISCIAARTPKDCLIVCSQLKRVDFFIQNSMILVNHLAWTSKTVLHILDSPYICFAVNYNEKMQMLIAFYRYN